MISVHMLCLDDCFATTTMPQPTEITQFIFGQPLSDTSLPGHCSHSMTWHSRATYNALSRSTFCQPSNSVSMAIESSIFDPQLSQGWQGGLASSSAAGVPDCRLDHRPQHAALRPDRPCFHASVRSLADLQPVWRVVAMI